MLQDVVTVEMVAMAVISLYEECEYFKRIDSWCFRSKNNQLTG